MSATRRIGVCGLLLAMSVGTWAWADRATVPSSANSTELIGGQEGPMGGTTNRRFMIIMDERALSGIPVGSTITGFRFRHDSNSGVAWPPVDVNIADYQLRISAAATTASTASTNYALNISGSQSLVMDGPLAIAAGAYVAGATPRPFGPLLTFDSAYVYMGGSLALDFDHSGTGIGTLGFADASFAAASDFTTGIYASSRTAATGSITSCPAIQFEYTPPTNSVVPESFEAAEAPSNQNGSIGGTTDRRYLFNINEAALNIPAGSIITGLAFRLSNERDAWPPSNTTISDYEVRIGPGVAVGSMSTTYASNFSSQTLVHDGPLDLNAHIFPDDATGATPEQFGLYIPFSTPLPYFGGNLSIDINYPGTGLTPSGFMDATSGTDFAAAGVRGLFSSDSRTAVTGALTNAPVTRLFYSPGPTPDLSRGVTKVYLADEFANAPAGTQSSSLLLTTARSVMIVGSADQFDTIGSGSRIVGHSTRVGPSGILWPGAASNFADYNIDLSRSVNPPGSLSTTFLNNVGADKVDVRTGPLSIPMNSFAPVGSGPTAPFGFTIAYQNAYPYIGGPLNVFMRHSGGSVAPTFLDTVPQSANAYGTKVESLFAPGAAFDTGSLNPAAMLRFEVDAAVSIPRGGPDTFNSSVAGLLDQSDYTIQTVIAASELRDIPVGSVIDELWLRNYPFTASPLTDAATHDFEMFLSTAARRPTTMSTTFALNEGSDVVQVYDGPLALRANTFPPGPGDRYGRLVTFQRGFVYRGGDLCITIRHRAFPLECVDAAIPPASERGRSIFANSFDAASGFVLGGATPRYYSMRLGYTPSVCTPNDLASAEGVNGLNILGGNSTLQIIIPASQLSAIDVGSAITGMSFRHSSSGFGPSFPTSAFNFTRFDVRVAPTTVAPTAMSVTVAANVGPGEVLVREGPLGVPANAFPATGSSIIPGEFAWFVSFDRAFIYPGGNLCVTIRTDGSPPGNNFLDTDGDFPTARGAMRYRTGDPNALTTDVSFGAFVTRLAFTARAFCPWDLNNDGVVDDLDFQIFVQAYDILDCNDAGMAAGCPSDFDYNRVVDDLDFQGFVVAYNELLCPQ